MQPDVQGEQLLVEKLNGERHGGKGEQEGALKFVEVLVLNVDEKENESVHEHDAGTGVGALKFGKFA